MQNFTISHVPFSSDELAAIDPRLSKHISGWRFVEQWEGDDKKIPDGKDAVIIPFNYDVAVNKPEGIQDDEIQLWLWCGWVGRDEKGNITGSYDAETIIVLSLNGEACHDPTIEHVNVELGKFGGTTMQVYYNDKLVTDFTDTSTFDFGWLLGKRTIKTPNGYQTRTMEQYL